MNFRLLKRGAFALAIGVLSTPSTLAKVSVEEAEKLGTTLTPVGGEIAGNAAGTIPTWDGGLTVIPEGFEPGKPYIDPYSEDPVLFTITQDNIEKYKDSLTPGQIAMFNKYPSFFMNVYQTRRSAVYNEETIKETKHNALNAITVDNGNGVENFSGVNPFPIPQSANEIIWNHIFRERGGSIVLTQANVAPTTNGTFSPVRFNQEFVLRDSLKDYAKNRDDNVLFYFKSSVVSPARLAGNVFLIHETINQVAEPRRAWLYNAGQRRVRRAPGVAYDGPRSGTDGMGTADEFDMYNGAPNLYDWELIGKKEIYVPYNAYKLDDTSLSYKDMVKPGHLAPEYSRYELHRVWVVEAKLKENQRHIYKTRTFYIDEDTWSIVATDIYDGRGELWRYSEGHTKLYYDQGLMLPTVMIIHDLISGRYIAQGLANEEKVRYTFGKKFTTKSFTPAALRRSGKR